MRNQHALTYVMVTHLSKIESTRLLAHFCARSLFFKLIEKSSYVVGVKENL